VDLHGIHESSSGDCPSGIFSGDLKDENMAINYGLLLMLVGGDWNTVMAVKMSYNWLFLWSYLLYKWG